MIWNLNLQMNEMNEYRLERLDFEELKKSFLYF